jgi:hypothetical protein
MQIVALTLHWQQWQNALHDIRGSGGSEYHDIAILGFDIAKSDTGFSTMNVEAGLFPELLVPMHEPAGSHIPQFPLT